MNHTSLVLLKGTNFQEEMNEDIFCRTDEYFRHILQSVKDSEF